MSESDPCDRRFSFMVLRLSVDESKYLEFLSHPSSHSDKLVNVSLAPDAAPFVGGRCTNILDDVGVRKYQRRVSPLSDCRTSFVVSGWFFLLILLGQFLFSIFESRGPAPCLDDRSTAPAGHFCSRNFFGKFKFRSSYTLRQCLDLRGMMT